MYKVAVMGERDGIYGFASLGLDIFEVRTGNNENRRIFRNIAEGDYAIIYITEEIYSELEDIICEYNTKLTPAIIPIPSVKGNNGIGMSNVNSFVEKAVGSNIL